MFSEDLECSSCVVTFGMFYSWRSLQWRQASDLPERPQRKFSSEERFESAIQTKLKLYRYGDIDNTVCYSSLNYGDQPTPTATPDWY